MTAMWPPPQARQRLLREPIPWIHNGNGSNFGRGTMVFNGRTFAFYIVDATHFKMLEEDASGGSTGRCASASRRRFPHRIRNSQVVSFISSAARQCWEPQGPVVARRAIYFGWEWRPRQRFRWTTIMMAITRMFRQGGTFLRQLTLSILPIREAGAAPSRLRTPAPARIQYVFYMISPTQAVVQETSNGIIGDGPLYAQTADPSQ